MSSNSSSVALSGRPQKGPPADQGSKIPGRTDPSGRATDSWPIIDVGEIKLAKRPQPNDTVTRLVRNFDYLLYYSTRSTKQTTSTSRIVSQQQHYKEYLFILINIGITEVIKFARLTKLWFSPYSTTTRPS